MICMKVISHLIFTSLPGSTAIYLGVILDG